MNAEQWNALYPVGTLVFAYPGCRPEDGTGTRLVTRTRTEAQLSSSGNPVVWVEGEGSYISLTHVDPVSEDVWDAARAAEKPAEPKAAPESAARLSPEREAEIAARRYSLRSLAAADVDIDALLAELDAVRAERDQARAELAEYEPLNPQQCPAGKHADWLVDSEYAHACPWCRVAELEAERHTTNEALSDAAEQLRRDRDRIAELEHPSTGPDTLAAWLFQRFYLGSEPWEGLDEDNRSYWEHEARAVRRAVARGGYKTEEPVR
ncbi:MULTISPECIES: hypothetical protein [Streptomyces]|uniref:hypothetical protein n=1 Tax=Streptomyces TaxID=1883 RepID=UPI00249F03E0|nr:hypothetical protein [Streptomyces rochei]